MLNINLGHNKELMEKCAPLLEYSKYVDKLNRYIKVMSIEEAALKTVNECIEEGILADFLTRHKAEVLQMLLTEYDEKETMEMFFRDGREEGLEAGREEGQQIGQKKALATIFQRLRELGKTMDEISELMGLSIEELEKL